MISAVFCFNAAIFSQYLRIACTPGCSEGKSLWNDKGENMKQEFSEEYLAVKLERINRLIDQQPSIYRPKRKGKYFIRYRQDGKLREIYPASANYKEAERRFFQKESLKQIQKQLQPMVRNKRNVKIRKDIVPVLSYDDYAKLIPHTTKDKDHPYSHKHFYMRSRFEVTLAGVLDSLELEYKYEPTLYLNGYQVSPDFVVFIPEFNCCIIIECEGMTDELNYINKNGYKLAEYLYSGLIVGMTLVVLQGGKTSMPSPELMRNSVISAINLLTSYYLF